MFPPIFLHHGGVPWCSLKSFERDCLRVVCWHLQIWSDLVVAILDCFHIDSWIVPHVQCVFSIIPAEKNCVLELSTYLLPQTWWRCLFNGIFRTGILVIQWRLHVYTKTISTHEYARFCLSLPSIHRHARFLLESWPQLEISSSNWRGKFLHVIVNVRFWWREIAQPHGEAEQWPFGPEEGRVTLKLGTSRAHASRCLLHGRYCPVTCYVLLLCGGVTSFYRFSWKFLLCGPLN